MAVAPALPWRKASAELLRERLLWPAVGATTVVVVSVALGVRGVAPLIAFGLGAFAAGAALRQRTNGGMVVHLGVVMIAVAFAASNAYVHQSEFRLEPGQTATFSGHTFTYQGWAEERTTERLATKARVLIDGEGPWEPAISRYFFGSQQVGTPSTRTNLREDIQLSLLDLPEGRDDPATIRVTVQPLVIWLWIGGITMAVGTVLAAFPGRRRRGTDPASARLPDVAPAGAEAPADEPEPAGVA